MSYYIFTKVNFIVFCGKLSSQMTFETYFQKKICTKYYCIAVHLPLPAALIASILN